MLTRHTRHHTRWSEG
ncbi:hypothetical protein F383_06878 [Gossypium arboreum]|uniref:Uncharacterized protein n=1 Tax=Gossypium arboreum TaxID=29729 RepID=A0A0B0NDF3_GOSAR|nr:hypothetical protein F383_06878 [Gossypium arboreum]